MSEMENKQQEQSDVSECGFAKKIWSLPMVRSAADVALSAYSHAKEYNSISKAAFGKAEETIVSVASYAKPLLVKIEAPLTVADKVACDALTKLEQKVPAITMTPQDFGLKAKQVWTDALKPAVDQYNTAVVYGTEKLNSAKVYGLTKANEVLETPIGKKVTGSLDEFLVWADKKVESGLPASTEGEVQPLDGNIGQKAAILSSKVIKRLRKRTDDHVAASKTYILHVYNKTDVPNTIQAVKTVIVNVARTSQFFAAAPAHLVMQAYNLPAYAKDSYEKLQGTPLPEKLHTAVTAAKSYTDKLYTPISEAKTWGDVSSAVTKNIATVADDLKMATWNAVELLRSSTAPTKASDAPHNTQ